MKPRDIACSLIMNKISLPVFGVGFLGKRTYETPITKDKEISVVESIDRDTGTKKKKLKSIDFLLIKTFQIIFPLQLYFTIKSSYFDNGHFLSLLFFRWGSVFLC